MENGAEKAFNKLFSELEDCKEEEQKVKIEEINEAMEVMRKEELESVFTKEQFDKMEQMIEEKKMLMENAILVLKHIGYMKELKFTSNLSFERSLLSKRFEEMIGDGNEKKEGKDEKLLDDLYECHLLNKCNVTSNETLKIYVRRLLKVALKKEEKEEVGKEVEMALMALSCIREYFRILKKLYLEEISEIIQHHQEHHNLTQLAYQSAWGFLISRFVNEKSLGDAIVNELHFAREAARELEELSKRVDWKRGKETKEEYILLRWFRTFNNFFRGCKLWNEEFAGLIESIVRILRTAKDNYGEISNQCISSLRNAADSTGVKVEDLLKGGAVDAVLEEIQQSIIDRKTAYECLNFFYFISWRMKEKGDDKMKEAKRKITKRELFEKLEEEGYEDDISSFYRLLCFLKKIYFDKLPTNISVYFVNV
ncbi:uncharacterized protein MONOS_4499 [Monocercomonoides exilis]|uniref:uncharacterized protein n=1 Tax=Monocercomonoides exilis TaxID=2049356 RepID=UPI00355A6D78|nr:hypothetical protein MONOS_4499 [Monocercomonoides exilis]|eukprot:MONOS_4499.1-p1 / transcript=MONOS_4499.1 / gene=MONOS_4499 / organism=Monocercomonoides_exilis_PA203 / gene_product=unspecified product / transcript_product=unspecified product / location=Mono_scaffold00120:66513-68045(-) / protein_length=425 / sequence_SO=supercontig / SO=protein_coding / is_pseudo=false